MAQTKIDCFAYDCRGCKILKKRFCDIEKCSFYKTREQHAEDMQKYPMIDYKGLYENRHGGEKELK